MTTRHPFLSLRRDVVHPTTLSTVLVALAGCGPPAEYSVGLRLSDRALRAQIETVEVVAVRTCSGITPGLPALVAQQVGPRQMLRSAGVAEPLGTIPPGRIGLYALARHETCQVMAVGCQEFDLERGGSGPLVVDLAAPPERIVCPDAQLCLRGVCQEAPCPDGQQACRGQCVSVASHRDHCGACGAACAAGEACVAGRCR